METEKKTEEVKVGAGLLSNWSAEERHSKLNLGTSFEIERVFKSLVGARM